MSTSQTNPSIFYQYYYSNIESTTESAENLVGWAHCFTHRVTTLLYLQPPANPVFVSQKLLPENSLQGSLFRSNLKPVHIQNKTRQ